MNPYAGTGLLMYQMFRRDRVVAFVWVGLLVVMTFASAEAVTSLYPDAVARDRAVALINGQAGLRALYGPVSSGAAGSLAMSKMTVLYALFAGMLCVVLVRRHTRVEEETGRAELIGATAVGRDAPLAAAVAESALLTLVLSGMVTIADITGGLPVAGSVAFGSVWFGSGLVATGIAAVAVQVSSSARACATVAAASLGALFVARAIGDATRWRVMGWVSPLGWNTRFDAWSQPRLWLLPCYAGTFALLLALAHHLRARRDLGSGLMADDQGPVRGYPWVVGPATLIVRVHLSMLLAWSAAVFGVALFFGVVTPGLDSVLTASGGTDLEHDLGGSMVVAILTEVAVVVGCFAVTIASHAGQDELTERATGVLATPQSRQKWLTAVTAFAAAGTAWLLALAGAGMWFGLSAAGGSRPFGAFEGALVWLPAVWLVVALSVALLSVDARWAPASWAWPFGFLLLSVVPPLLGLPGWVHDLSPFAHVPAVPFGPMRWTPEVVMVLAAATVVVVARRRMTTRDIG